MQTVWQRPLRLLIGIPLIAVLGLLRVYWSDFNFERALPIDRDLAGLIVGAVIVLLLIVFANDRNPRSAEEGSDYLAHRYDWVPMAMAVVLFASLAGTISLPAFENTNASGIVSFARQHLFAISAGLLGVAGMSWLIDTCVRKTPNRLEFVISRLLMTALSAGVVAGYFVLDRAHLALDFSRLSSLQYMWIVTGALIASLGLLRK